MKRLISYYVNFIFTRKFTGLLIENLIFDYREYVREVKVRLVKYLTSCPLSPNHAKEFFTMLLDEYQALSKAFDILRPFFSKLVRQIFLCSLFSHMHDIRFIVVQLVVMYDCRYEFRSSIVMWKCILSVFNSFETKLRSRKYCSAFSIPSLYNLEDMRHCDCLHC